VPVFVERPGPATEQAREIAATVIAGDGTAP